MPGTIIASASETHRCTPSDQKGKKKPRAYLIASPTRYLAASAQGRITADLASAAAALGVEAIQARTFPEMFDLVRRGVEAVVVADDRDNLVSIINAYAEAFLSGPSAIPDELRSQYQEIETTISRAWPTYRHAVEDFRIANDAIIDAAVRRYVVGIVNGPAYKRDRDGLTDDVLADIPAHHRLEIYAFVVRLSGPDKDQAKNSD